MRIFRLRSLLLAALCCLCAPVATAKEACDVSKLSVRAESAADYFPFEDRGQTLRISLEGAGEAPCRLKLKLVSNDGVLRSGADALAVELRTREGRRLLPNSGEGAVITLSPGGLSSVAGELVATFPARQLVPAGLYQGEFDFQISREGGADQFFPFILMAQVAAQADIRLASSAAGARGGGGIDFGALVAGAQETALVSIRSNSAYVVEAESLNRGYLISESGAGQGGRIPYTAWFNQHVLPLQHRVSIPQQFGPTGQKGKLDLLRFQVGEIAGAPSGVYRDSLRLTVILLE